MVAIYEYIKFAIHGNFGLNFNEGDLIKVKGTKNYKIQCVFRLE